MKSEELTDERVWFYQAWTVAKTCIKEYLHFSVDLFPRVKTHWI